MKHFSSLRGWPAALLVLLWLARPAAQAQAPAWSRVAVPTLVGPSGANSNYMQADAVVADANSNVFLAGSFVGTVRFGGTTLTSTGVGSDIYVAKFNPVSNQFVWAQRAGGPGSDFVTAAAVSNNSVYVAGTFYGSNIQWGTTTLANAGGSSNTYDLFVGKLTDTGSSGALVWSVRAGGTDSDFISGLTSNAGNVYLTGTYGGSGATFGSIAFAGTGRDESFVAQISDTGTTGGFGWAQTMGGSTRANAIVATPSGIYVAGSFSATAVFGTTTLVGAGTTDAFAAKFIDTGTGSAYNWATRAGGTSASTRASALTIDGPNVYVAGVFQGNAVGFGTAVLAATRPNFFVTKLLEAGGSASFSWAQQTNGDGGPQNLRIATSGSSVFLAGWFGGTLSNPISFGATTLTPNPGSPAYTDAFLAKLTETAGSAAFAWVKQVGSYGTEMAAGVVISGRSVCMTGYFNSPSISFDNINFVNPSFAGNAYLASLTDPTLTATVAPRGTLSFSLAPNPARAAATVQLPAVPGATKATLTLTDALGRTVRTASVPLIGRHELDLRGLAPGLYAVQVQAGNTRGTQRLVVE